jgi:hypothetical protein
MSDYLWLAAGLAIFGFLAYRAGRVWVDAGQRGFDPAQRLGWALLGAVAPSRYWWGARIEELSPPEREELVARETAALGLSRADSLRCPLCTAEVPHAWALTPDGRPTITPGPVECPRCDVRALQSSPGVAAHRAGLPAGRGPPVEGTGLGPGPRPADHHRQLCAPRLLHRLHARPQAAAGGWGALA